MKRNVILIACLLVTGISLAVLPDDLTVTVDDVTGDGQSDTVVLTKRSLRASDCKVWQYDQDTGYTEITPTQVRTYRGYVQSDPSIQANAWVDQYDLVDIYMNDGRQHLATRVNQTADLSEEGTLDPGTGNVVIPRTVDRTSPTPANYIIPKYTMSKMRVGVNIQADLYNSFGGVIGRVIGYVEQRINDSDYFYARDMGLAWEIAEIVVCVNGDPVNWSGFWKTGSGVRDVNTMVRFRNLAGGGSLGRVFSDIEDFPKDHTATCGTSYKSYSASLGHEVAHGLAAGHGSDWRDTMDGSHSCLATGTVQRMIEQLHLASETSAPAIIYDAPLVPYAMRDVANTPQDQPVNIDLFENDYDGNGDTLTLAYVDSVSQQGGTITSDPNGWVTYTPPAGYLGVDRFTYHVADSGGLTNRNGSVKVYVRNTDLATRLTLDETSGTTAYDVGPYQADGVLGEAGTPFSEGTQPGIIGNAYESLPGWDGKTRIASDVGDPLTDDLSASLWVKFNKLYNGAILTKGGAVISSRLENIRGGWTIGVLDSNFNFTCKLQRDSTSEDDHADLRHTEDIQIGQWYHLVMTMDREAKQLRAWVNNTEVTNSPRGTTIPDGMIESYWPLTLFNFSRVSASITCVMDDFRIYNKALTPADVNELYDELIPPNAAADTVNMDFGDPNRPIDVLANDFEGNEPGISIVSFDSVSTQGGTVIRSVGTGPNGRDELIYDAPTGHYGADAFSYTIQNGSSLTNTGQVNIFITLPVDGLLYLPLDETIGATAHDYSGNDPAHDATLNNGATWTPDGYYHGGLSFDGVDDDIKTGNFARGDAQTVALWVKPDVTDHALHMYIYNDNADSGSTASKVLVEINDGNWYGRMYTGYNKGEITGPAATPGIWTHVAYIYEYNVGAKLYINGVLEGSATATKPLAHTGVCKFASPSFVGTLDETYVFDYALTPEEITALKDGTRTQFAERPFPPDGNTAFNPCPGTVTWMASPAAARYHVYLGTSKSAVQNADPAWPQYVGFVTAMQANLQLDELTTYYWRVDTEMPDGTILPGPVWSFTTLEAPPAPQVYYHLDETSETSAYDSSGNDNDATVTGATWTDGYYHGGLSFDGVNDYATTESFGRGNAQTVAFWAKPLSVSFGQTQQIWNDNGAPQMVISIDDYSKWEGRMYSGGAGSVGIVSGPEVVTGEWTHIAYTYDYDAGEDGEAELFINGVSVDTATAPAPLAHAGTARWIGAHPNPLHFYNGILDEIQVYGDALTDDQVSLLYNSYPNASPYFISDPFVESKARQDAVYSAAIADDAADDAGDPLSFSKVSGPDWLNVAADGVLSGNPAISDAGFVNEFTVEVDDNNGSVKQATLEIEVFNAADTDISGTVDTADLITLVSYWLDDSCDEPQWCDWADIDRSSIVDIADFARIAEKWLE